ncbi:hypothetical protein JOB18_018428 [Solea senegalensis]|uniref:Uncharacterized protein n=1 Tax=Solea senegalensis TaxID=28829 RepID=A0AAV6QE05_SOLSE|nr:uncharacterized protein C2orf81 homolog [Solea senegalensis]KAG7489716.1 hypothetical protein JOB18_018428 [Solea senegalensis]
MPRSVVKSQGSKEITTPSGPATPPPVQDPEYIVPGRLTKAQWTKALRQEHTDDIVGEIVDDLLNKVMEGCLKAHVKGQLVPYCTSWAKSYFTRILEQQIMCPDEGEEPEEAPKPEDTEPFPAPCDPWAQGSVPVVSATHQTYRTVSQQDEGVQVPAQTETTGNQQCNGKGQTTISPKRPDKETSPKKPGSDKHCNGISPRPPPTTNQRRKQLGSLVPRPVQGKLLPVLSYSARKKEAEVESKNRIYLVRPKVADNNYTKANPRITNGFSKLESKFTKPQTERTMATLPPLTSSKD